MTTTHPNPLAATADERDAWDYYGGAHAAVTEPRVNMFGTCFDTGASRTLTAPAVTAPAPVAPADTADRTTAVRTEWMRQSVKGDRATFTGGRWVSGNGRADYNGCRLIGMDENAPAGMEIIGNPFAEWIDDELAAGKSDPRVKGGESHTWCRLCDYVVGSDAPIAMRVRRVQASCDHVLTTMIHDAPAANVGRTAMLVSDTAGTATVHPTAWQTNAAGDYTRATAELSRDHGRRVTVLRVATAGAQPFGTSAHPDMMATAASRELIGNGGWVTRTGESARFATPDRGAVRVGIDIDALTATRGNVLATFTTVRWETTLRTKNLTVRQSTRRRNAAVATVKRAIETGIAPAPVSARAMRRRVADATRAAAREINVATGVLVP